MPLTRYGPDSIEISQQEFHLGVFISDVLQIWSHFQSEGYILKVGAMTFLGITKSGLSLQQKNSLVYSIFLDSKKFFIAFSPFDALQLEHPVGLFLLI